MSKTCAFAGAVASIAALSASAQDLAFTWLNPGGGDVFQFQVANNTSETFLGANFGGIPGQGDGGFSGNFVNLAASPLTFSSETSGVVSGDQESYFAVSSTTGLLSINRLDDASSLEAAYSFGFTGDVVLGPNATAILAVLSTSDGVEPVFLGGELATGPSFADPGETFTIEAAISFILGDINEDGTVNGADAGILLGQFGQSGDLSADLNNDNVVNGADAGILLGNFGETIFGASLAIDPSSELLLAAQSVPEPITLAMVAIGLVGLSRRRRTML